MCAFLVIWLFWNFFKNAGGVQCLKNDDIGYRQGNIYSCNDPDLSACCEMDGQFTCCEPNYVKNTREQFKLWGSICVFVLVIVGVYTCLHRDVQWISGQTIQESLGINKKDRVEHASSIPLTNSQSGEKT
ncbi:uncharacterized protein LOC128178568 [Crassostrea angulata]|uniref:uncharacterized protein n=1 Tax=Magallana gigas TaxID=29159 RepID=UPI0005C39FE1|nr:uncharacterized protein LOC128178568 [Crassostrea angulata]|eukprot:XP_011422797.1 PREDICTED: uncharacterized protein LOC105325081 [Crassostrea gigas]